MTLGTLCLKNEDLGVPRRERERERELGKGEREEEGGGVEACILRKHDEEDELFYNFVWNSCGEFGEGNKLGRGLGLGSEP